MFMRLIAGEKVKAGLFSSRDNYYPVEVNLSLIDFIEARGGGTRIAFTQFVSGASGGEVVFVKYEDLSVWVTTPYSKLLPEIRNNRNSKQVGTADAIVDLENMAVNLTQVAMMWPGPGVTALKFLNLNGVTTSITADQIRARVPQYFFPINNSLLVTSPIPA